MKKIIVLLSAITLLFCINACEKEQKNKGRFEKNIPECVKEEIKKDIRIATAEEYCNEDGTKKIYYLIYTEDFWGFPPPFSSVYDEDCDKSPVQTENRPIVSGHNDVDLSLRIATWYPNRTIEYKGDIYYFKRTVFTQKNKKGDKE